MRASSPRRNTCASVRRYSLFKRRNSNFNRHVRMNGNRLPRSRIRGIFRVSYHDRSHDKIHIYRGIYSSCRIYDFRHRHLEKFAYESHVSHAYSTWDLQNCTISISRKIDILDYTSALRKGTMLLAITSPDNYFANEIWTYLVFTERFV